MRALICVAMLAVVTGVPGAARAFRDQSLFGEEGVRGGGGGSFYTGSPGSRGYDCSICHVEAPGRARLRVAVDPPALAQTGSWEAGTSYRITVRLEGATGVQSAFAAEIVGTDGAPRGELEPFDATVSRPAGTGAVFGNGSSQAAWTFDWIAPPAGSGSVTLYLAAVDGDGAAGSGSDLYRDDVAVASLALSEAGSSGPNVRPTATFEASGCRTAGGSGASFAPVWLLVALLLPAISCSRSRRPLRPARR
ncbi:MAG: hypothetical protein HYY06_23355 [Deltaproteobacteria bacterium]|nr:hypothetical protein [Deltaproteobacteria bacterium]